MQKTNIKHMVGIFLSNLVALCIVVSSENSGQREFSASDHPLFTFFFFLIAGQFLNFLVFMQFKAVIQVAGMEI